MIGKKTVVWMFGTVVSVAKTLLPARATQLIATLVGSFRSSQVTPEGIGDDAANDTTALTEGVGEAAGRDRGLETGGGSHANEGLRDGQLRGVDEDGQIIAGLRGGPRRHATA